MFSPMFELQHMDEMQMPAVMKLNALLNEPLILPAEGELSSTDIIIVK